MALNQSILSGTKVEKKYIKKNNFKFLFYFPKEIVYFVKICNDFQKIVLLSRNVVFYLCFEVFYNKK